MSVAVRLFSNISHMLKCGQNISDTLACSSRATVLFLHFDVICDLLLNRCTGALNLFVKYALLFKSKERIQKEVEEYAK